MFEVEKKNMLKEELLTLLKDYKKQNGEKYGIIALGLFGSVARGEERENSDVDIVVKTKIPNPFILVHIKEDIENTVHRHVDIVSIWEKMNPYLKERIEKEGIYV